MDLRKRIVLLKSSVKEGEYLAFTPKDVIFLFEEVTCPEGVILNYTDPTDCYGLFTPLVQMDDIYNLNKDPSWVGGSMALTIRQPPASILNIVRKLVENKSLEEGEKYELLPIEPEGKRGAEGPQPHSTPKRKAEPVASVLTEQMKQLGTQELQKILSMVQAELRHRQDASFSPVQEVSVILQTLFKMGPSGMHADVISYINSCPRYLRRKSQQDKAPLLNIETNQPLELIHLDYLKIEPSKGNIENVLVITDDFTRYAQAFPSKTQTALATAKLLWNNFILHYGFPEKIITDQGSELIGHLCQLAGVQKLRTSPYHPQTNGQCERFNGTLLNMLGTLTPEQKKDWKSHVPALVHAYNCTRNVAIRNSPYFLLFGREPRLPVDVEFGLLRGGQRGSPGESSYISQLKRRLQYAYRKAKYMAQKQHVRHRGLYNLRCWGATLSVGDLVLVKQTAWKGRHKIQDKWEDREYQVVDQPTPGIPVYTVQSLTESQTKVLHKNLLLPLQGRLRQEGETVGEGVTDSEGEEEEKAVTPCVARTLRVALKTVESQDDLTPAEPEAFLITDIPPSDSSSVEEDSNGESVYDSLTSNTTASSSTSADIQSAEASINIPHSITESQFSVVMPYKEDSGQTSSEVFAETLIVDPYTSQQISQSLDTPEASNVNGTPP